MIVSLEKPGTPEELVHFGVKGMQWGVRKAVDTAIGTKTAGRKPSSYKKPLTPEAAFARRAHRKKIAKDVATVALGVGLMAAGTAAVIYTLHGSGGTKLSSLTMGSKRVGKKALDPRIAEQMKNLKLAIKHPDVPPAGKEEARALLKMLESIQ